jgi:pimeloyl-ACP methyl ester carboxylesterase
MGANIAGLYAGVMPERVRAFVNIEGFGLPDSDPSDAPGRYRDWIEKGRRLRDFGSFEDLGGLARHLTGRSPHLGRARALFVAEAWACDAPEGIRLRADPAHKLPNAVLYRRAEAEACWREVTAPVLFVTGAESTLLDVLGESAQVSNYEPQFPDSRSRVIDAAGHMVHFEAPAALARAIEKFLEATL